MALLPGGTYRLSGWVKTTAGARTDLCVRITLASGALEWQCVQFFDTAYTFDNVTFTVPATMVDASVTIWLYEPQGMAYADDLALTPVVLSDQLRNGDFEAGILDWSSWNGSRAVNDQVHSGSGALGFTARGGRTQLVAFRPSQSYRLSAWAKSPNGTSWICADIVRSTNPKQSFCLDVASTVYASDTITFTTPADTVSGSVWIWAPGVAYVDDIALSRDPLPPATGGIIPSPLTGSGQTSIISSTAFLYTGPNPVQWGVQAGTIQPTRAAVIRGRVLSGATTPLAGVTVTIHDHPEYGATRTRADGMFDLAVNGGQVYTLDYQHADFLPVQRTVTVPRGQFAWAPEVILVSLSPVVTTIDFNSATVQVARSGVISDSDGLRESVLLFPPQISATMVLSNGLVQPLSSLAIRSTEYTVGAGGPRRMPAILPSNTGYTYAVEHSVDAALGAGAVRVEFNQPIINYVSNFIGFPVGTDVPTGYYDRDRSQWIPSANGKVIKIVAITGGAAQVDSTGDGLADAPALLGMTPDEQTRLASLYPVGTELWRVAITHFTPWDYNWPVGPPADSTPPPDPNKGKGKGSKNGDGDGDGGPERDTDGDGKPDHEDDDDDGDGTPDPADPDRDGDGKPNGDDPDTWPQQPINPREPNAPPQNGPCTCLLYTSDAADE